MSDTGINPADPVRFRASELVKILEIKLENCERNAAETLKNAMSLALFIGENGLSEEYEAWVTSRWGEPQ